MSERIQTLSLLVLLACVGVGAWTLELRDDLAVDATALDTLPFEIAQHKGYDIPVDPTVARILDADIHVQRTYRHDSGPPVWLYIGYYGTKRGGYTPHTPDACYPAAGWDIDESSIDTRQLSTGLAVNELQVTHAGERRLVQYWYRSHRATGILGEVGQAFDRVIGRLLHGRADGGFVRVSTRIEDGRVDTARARVQHFARELDPLLARHWPDEQ